jgi:hypothetical protein
MSTLAVNTITNAAGGNTAQINGMTPTADSLQGFRNRIINGDMRIDQRNAGAAVTVNSGSDFYAVDRFSALGASADGVFTVQQVTDAPIGFKNSVKITVTAADASIGLTQRYLFRQAIEGNNVADLGFGGASASSVTVSFRVKSSVTGTFSGSLQNSAQDRAYPFNFSISSANTWEEKSVIIAGDTSGTWLTDNGAGLRLNFDLGCGSSYRAASGAWAAQIAYGATGSVQLISTIGATFYITGVQLEKGSVATEFERRPYGTELALCQRYFERFGQAGTGRVVSATVCAMGFSYSVTKRATPTIALVNNAVTQIVESAVAFRTVTAIASSEVGNSNGVLFDLTVGGGGMTSPNMVIAYPTLSRDGFLSASAEL